MKENPERKLKNDVKMVHIISKTTRFLSEQSKR